jgi:hypothetical protein
MVFELADERGIVLRRDVVAAGYDDNALARVRRQGGLVRVRQGAYVRADVWGDADAAQRHHLMSRAVLRQYPLRVALSHDSAAVEHDGPTYGLDLGSVHLTHFHDEHAGRRYAGIVHHEGECRVGDLTRLPDGHWVTAPARTLLDTAARHPVEVGVCLADDFLHRGLVTKDELRIAHQMMKTWPGMLRVHRVIDLADGRSESVGETRGRLLMKNTGLPTPVPQLEVFDHQGNLVGRCDLALPDHGVLIEFDGTVKYHRYRRPGETIEQMVLREKAREDRLREVTGWRMVRLVWADLSRPEATAARIRRQITGPR